VSHPDPEIGAVICSFALAILTPGGSVTVTVVGGGGGKVMAGGIEFANGKIGLGVPPVPVVGRRLLDPLTTVTPPLVPMTTHPNRAGVATSAAETA